MKKKILLSVAIFATFLLGATFAVAAGVPAFLGGAGLTTVISLMPSVQGTLVTSVDITALEAALGAYTRKDKGILVRRMLLGMEGISDRMDVWDDVKDEAPLPSLTVTELIKPADAENFTPTPNGVVFDARMLKVRPWKVDLQIIPQNLYRSWLGKHVKQGSDIYDVPFEQFIMEEIIKRVQNDLRMRALFNGVYNGSGTAAVDVMTGVHRLIADEITAGEINPVATGVITKTTTIDAVEATHDGLSEDYKNTTTQAMVGPTLFAWYVRDYRLRYGGNMDYLGMAKDSVYIDGTNCILKKEPGMGTSQRIIVCTPDNLTYGVDSLSDENNIVIEKEKRALNIMVDAKSGVDFKEVHGDALAVNDQA